MTVTDITAEDFEEDWWLHPGNIDFLMTWMDETDEMRVQIGDMINTPWEFTHLYEEAFAYVIDQILEGVEMGPPGPKD